MRRRQFLSNSPVIRGDMSILLARTSLGSAGADALPAYSGGFTDVAPGDYYSKTVRWAKDAGITAGCGDGTTFCPTAAVTREEMAVFLTRAFGLPVAASQAAALEGVTHSGASAPRHTVDAAECLFDVS